MLEPLSAFDTDSTLQGLAGGGAVFAYSDFTHVSVRRAAPGARFGAEQPLGTAPRGWLAFGATVAANAHDDLVVAWNEFTDDAECGSAFCFNRVRAAGAVASAPFGPARVLSPLGTQPESAAVVALSEQGRRLVAWQSDPVASRAAGALWVALGDVSADRAPRVDRRAPRVHAAASRKSLRAGTLRALIRANEPCVVRLAIYGASDDDGYRDSIEDLRIVVLRKAGVRSAVWSLSTSDRAILRGASRRHELDIEAAATDSAGNLHTVRVPLR